MARIHQSIRSAGSHCLGSCRCTWETITGFTL